MNLPNLLTALRFLMVPLLYIIYFSGMKYAFMLSMGIFFLAGLTDILDGRIARKYNLVTKWGTLLDPAADKLMAITVLYSLSRSEIIPTWIFIIFLVKEFIMLIGGLRLLKDKTVVSANYYGKYATFFLYLSIAFIIIDRDTGTYLLYASIAMTILAFFNYLLNFIKISKDIKHGA